MDERAADGRKREARAQIKKAAAELTAVYIKQASEKIAGLVLSMPETRRAKTVFCYVGTDREPDTSGLIRALLDAGKTVCVPRCLEKGVMEAVKITSGSDLVPGKYGIPEPKDGLPVIPAEDADLCIVPCLSAGTDGGRLGHGGGYYDRWLAACPGRKVCLCFEALRREGLPVGEKDILMDAVVTEKGVSVRGA